MFRTQAKNSAHLQRRLRPITTAASCAAIIFLLFLSGSATSASTFPHSLRSSAPLRDPTQAAAGSAASMVARAEASLRAGATSATTTSPSWTYVSPELPPNRDLPQLVYDAQDAYVLLFSGGTAKVPNPDDTWKFTGTAWIQLHPAISPAGRVGGAIAYDAVDKYVVLFGGHNTTTGTLGDTWKFVKGAWTKLTPSTHPGPLAGASMSFDAKDGYAVLFGGSAANGTRSSGTWSFKGGSWTLLTSSSSPPARNLAMMSYDAKDGYVLLFGGNGTGNHPLNDTWTFVGGSWSALSPAVSPAAREAGAMAFSALDSEVVLFGGTTNFTTAPSSPPSWLSDTWSFSAGSWTKLSTLLHPSNRFAAGAADGTAHQQVVLFGGFGSPSHSYDNDTWKFKGNVWDRYVPALPISRVGYSLAYDEADGYVLLFGGEAEFNGPAHFLNDSWKFSAAGWAPITTSVAPSARWQASMVYDQGDGYILLFGGQGTTGPLADTWSFHAGVWSRVVSATGPTARYSAYMSYDAADGYVLLFGGFNSAGDDGDTWTYFGGVWTELNLTGHPTPPAAGNGAMTYDSEDGYVLLYSGDQVAAKVVADTWNFSNGRWTNITSVMSHSPTGLYGAALVDDTYDGYPLLQGGADPSGLELSNSWKFTPTGWVQLSPAQNPGPTYWASMAFEPAANAVILLTPDYPPGTWSY
jgi:hypothetical protein